MKIIEGDVLNKKLLQDAVEYVAIYAVANGMANIGLQLRLISGQVELSGYIQIAF